MLLAADDALEQERVRLAPEHLERASPASAGRPAVAGRPGMSCGVAAPVVQRDCAEGVDIGKVSHRPRL